MQDNPVDEATQAEAEHEPGGHSRPAPVTPGCNVAHGLFDGPFAEQPLADVLQQARIDAVGSDG